VKSKSIFIHVQPLLKTMIKKSISRELRDKIIKDIELSESDVEGFGPYDYKGVLFFTPTEMHLLDECKEWLEVINLYFLTSYHACSIDKMGNLKGIRPKHIFCNRAEFTVLRKRKENWKDWFIPNETELNFT